MPRNERLRVACLLRIRLTIIAQLKCQPYLVLHLLPCLLFQARREETGLLKDELALQELERVEGGRATHAFRRDLSAVGAVKRPESCVLLHAHFGHIDHPAPLGRSEFLFRVVNPHVIVVRFKRAKPWAACAQIQFPADRENGVPERLSFQSLRRKSPEQTRPGVSRNSLAARGARLAINSRGD